MATMTYHQTTNQIREEETWIEAAKSDPKAFAPIYQKYHEPILQFLYLRVDTKEVAFDLTQQVFLKAMNKLDKYESRGFPYSAYLYRVALNELNQYFRDQKKFRTVNIDTTSVADVAAEIQQTEHADDVQLLAGKLTRLSSADYLLIEMRYFEKRSFKEIGQILEITENNAKVRTYRALDRLKSLF